MNKVKCIQFVTFLLLSFTFSAECKGKKCSGLDRCPHMFTYYETGHKTACISRGTRAMPFLLHRQECRGKNPEARVVLITSQSKNDFIKNLGYFHFEKYIWLNLEYIGKTGITKLYPFIKDAEIAPYTNFKMEGEGSPSMALTTTDVPYCVVMDTITGKWELKFCHLNAHSVCEVEPYKHDPHVSHISVIKHKEPETLIYSRPYRALCDGAGDTNDAIYWALLVDNKVVKFYTHDESGQNKQTSEYLKLPTRGCTRYFMSNLTAAIPEFYVSPGMEDRVKISCMITSRHKLAYQCHGNDTSCLNVTVQVIREVQSLGQLLKYHVKEKSVVFAGIKAVFQCSVCAKNAKLFYFFKENSELAPRSNRIMSSYWLRKPTCEYYRYGHDELSVNVSMNNMIWGCQALIDGHAPITEEVLHVEVFPAKPHLYMTQNEYSTDRYVLKGVTLRATCTACIGFTGTLTVTWELLPNTSLVPDRDLTHFMRQGNITKEIGNSSCGTKMTSIIYLNVTTELEGAQLYCYTYKGNANDDYHPVYTVTPPFVIYTPVSFDTPVDDTSFLVKLVLTILIYASCFAIFCYFCGGKRQQKPKPKQDQPKPGNKFPARKFQTAISNDAPEGVPLQSVYSDGTNVDTGLSRHAQRSSRQLNLAKSSQTLQGKRPVRTNSSTNQRGRPPQQNKPNTKVRQSPSNTSAKTKQASKTGPGKAKRSENRKRMLEKIKQIKQQRYIKQMMNLKAAKNASVSQATTRQSSEYEGVQDEKLEQILYDLDKGSSVDPSVEGASIAGKSIHNSRQSAISARSEAQETFIS